MAPRRAYSDTGSPGVLAPPPTSLKLHALPAPALTSFGAILTGMALVTGWASRVQPVWEWSGLTTPPNHAWTIATLCDAYCGF